MTSTRQASLLDTVYTARSTAARQYSNAWQSHERQHSGPRVVTRRPAQRSARLGRDCTVGQSFRPSSRHVSSGRPANTASHDARTATGRCARLMSQLSAVIFSLLDCTTTRSQTPTTTPNCLTRTSVAFSTSTHHCAPVVVVVDNMTFVSCLMKHAKPSSSAVA